MGGVVGADLLFVFLLAEWVVAQVGAAEMAGTLSRIRCMRVKERDSRVERYATWASMLGRMAACVSGGRELKSSWRGSLRAPAAPVRGPLLWFSFCVKLPGFDVSDVGGCRNTLIVSFAQAQNSSRISGHWEAT